MTQKSLLYLKQKLTNDAGFTNPVLGNHNPGETIGLMTTNKIDKQYAVAVTVTTVNVKNTSNCIQYK